MVVLGIHYLHIKCHYRRLIFRSKYHGLSQYNYLLYVAERQIEDCQYRVFIWLAGYVNVVI